MEIIKNKTLWSSFNNAIKGIVYVVKTQRNMRIHFLLAFVVLIAILFLNLTKIEVLILVFTIMLVLIVEMINSAIEVVINLITETYHPLARMAKDIAAGAVMFAAINAFIVGYLIFMKFVKLYVESELEVVLFKVQRSPEYITLICLLIVIILVLMGKTMFKKGSPLRGGMPSGHSAIAFAIWTTTIYVHPGNVLVVCVPVFILACLIVHSRIALGIHNWWEGLTGAFLGVLVTTLIFQIFT